MQATRVLFRLAGQWWFALTANLRTCTQDGAPMSCSMPRVTRDSDHFGPNGAQQQMSGELFHQLTQINSCAPATCVGGQPMVSSQRKTGEADRRHAHGVEGSVTRRGVSTCEHVSEVRIQFRRRSWCEGTLFLEART